MRVETDVQTDIRVNTNTWVRTYTHAYILVCMHAKTQKNTLTRTTPVPSPSYAPLSVVEWFVNG